MQIHLRVYGATWGGGRACYQYSVDKAPQTDQEAKRCAGDFESLIDWYVMEETNEYEDIGAGISRRIDTFKTLRGWRNGFSDARYNRIVNDR